MTSPLYTQTKPQRSSTARHDAQSRLIRISALVAVVAFMSAAWQYVRTRHANLASASGSLTVQDAPDAIAKAHPQTAFASRPTARVDQTRDNPSETHALAAEETLQTSGANAGAPAAQTLPRPERPEPRALSDVLASWAHAATNPRFTREMKSYLEETARAVSLDPNLVDSAECRGNICRVKLRFATPESALAFQDAANPSADYTVYLAGAEQMDPSILPGASPALDVTIERALPPTAANDRTGSEP